EITYGHEDLRYRTLLTATGDATWRADQSRLSTRLRLDSQQAARLALHVRPIDYENMPEVAEITEIEAHWRAWRDDFARVTIEKNRVAEETLRSNLRDLASYPLLQ